MRRTRYSCKNVYYFPDTTFVERRVVAASMQDRLLNTNPTTKNYFLTDRFGRSFNAAVPRAQVHAPSTNPKEALAWRGPWKGDADSHSPEIPSPASSFGSVKPLIHISKDHFQGPFPRPISKAHFQGPFPKEQSQSCPMADRQQSSRQTGAASSRAWSGQGQI
jgi:hypothetical protein